MEEEHLLKTTELKCPDPECGAEGDNIMKDVALGPPRYGPKVASAQMWRMICHKCKKPFIYLLESS